MSFKTILSVISAHKFASDLHAAIALCRSLNAHLSVNVVSLAGSPPTGDYAAVVSDAWFEERRREQHELDRSVSSALASLKKADISFDITGHYLESPWIDEMLGQKALYTDLTLVGANLNFDPILRKCALKGCLFESGRPILLLSASHRVPFSPEIVLLAWNAEIEAARAVQHALDFMKTAKSVHVLIIDPETTLVTNAKETGAEIAAYLAHHGIHATVDQLSSDGHIIADVITQNAVSIKADLIVMGAYGHSRLHARIFGSVTKILLEATAISVLAVH